MSEPKRALVCLRLPPLDAAARTHRRLRAGADLSRLGRLAACLVALALPAFGIVAADTVHRVAPSKATQAAASGSPSQDAAVADGVSRAGNPVREALLVASERDPRR